MPLLKGNEDILGGHQGDVGGEARGVRMRTQGETAWSHDLRRDNDV